MSLKDKIEIVGLTDAGLVRDHNEDAIGNDTNLGLAVLADGMGGHRGGEVASAITVSTILDAVAQKLKESRHGTIDQTDAISLESKAVNDAIVQANANVYASSNENSHYRGMGTTVVVLLFHDDRFTVAHVGDSRLYRYRDGSLERMTNDHSLTQELLDNGYYTQEQAEQSLNKHLVTRAIGIEESVQIDILEDDTRPGDIYLLCSDGLTDMIDDKRISRTISENADDLEKIASELVRESNRAGGKDNVSTILARPLKPFPASNSLFSRFFDLFS